VATTAESFGLFGRETAFRVLSDVLSGGGCAVVSGAAGLGKSSLLKVGGQVAEQRGLHRLSIAPTEFDRGLPFAGIAELLTQFPEDIHAVLPGPQRRAVAIALQQVEPDGSKVDPLAVPLGIRTLLTSLCDRTRVALVVDDVQWLDQASMGCLTFALRRIGVVPGRLAVLVGARPEGLNSEFVRTLPDAGREVVLGPLAEPAIAQMLRHHFGDEWTQPVSRGVARASSGNPFLALMIGHAMHSELSKWSWSASDGHDPVFPVPPSLAEILGEKVSLLPQEAKEVLLLVSAAGRLTVGQLEGLVEPSRVAAALEAAADWDVATVGADSRVSFTHPMLGSALYEASTPAQRRHTHRLLAESLEDPVERARHRSRTLAAPDLDIAKELEQAAEISASRGAQQLAGELLEASARATPSSTDGDVRFALWMRVVDTYIHAGATNAARDALENASSLAADPQRQAEVILRRVDLMGRMPAARAITEEGLRLAPENSEVHNALTSLLGALHRLAGNGDEALRLVSAAVASARRGTNPTALFRALNAQMTVERHWGSGDAARTHKEIEELLDTARSEIPEALVAWTHAFYAPWNDPAAADQARSAIRHAVDQGRYGDLTQLYVALVVHLARASRIAEAQDALHEADQVGGWVLSSFQEQIAKGLVAAFSGEVDLCRQVAYGAATEARAIESTYWLSAFLAQIGFIENSVGEWQAGLAALRELADIFDATRMINFEQVLWAVDYADAALQVGAFDEVERAIEVLRRQGVSGQPDATAAAARCHALLTAARGDVESALHELVSIVDLEGVECPFEAARSLMALGQAYRRAGYKGMAAQTLTSAAEIFDQVGTPRWAERARAEAGRVGLRPSKSGLTATERRVAELVAQGNSNHEVAAALFISVKTVEANLTRVYRKLGVRSRTELAAHLGTGRTGNEGPPA
jgi:DNA-binding CsgD family transcriptional regulator